MTAFDDFKASVAAAQAVMAASILAAENTYAATLVVAPPPSPPAASPDGTTIITVGPTLTDAAFHVWSLSPLAKASAGQVILKDGIQAYGGGGVLITIRAGIVYVQNSSGKWYKDTGSDWLAVANAPDVTGTVTPPVTPPPVNPPVNPNHPVITSPTTTGATGEIVDSVAGCSYITIWSGGHLTDAAGHVWTLDKAADLDHYGTSTMRDGAVYASGLAMLLTIKSGVAWMQRQSFPAGGPDQWFMDNGTAWVLQSTAPFAISWRDIPVHAAEAGLNLRARLTDFSKYTSLQDLVDNYVVDVNNTMVAGYQWYVNCYGGLPADIWSYPALKPADFAFADGALTILRDSGGPNGYALGLMSIAMTNLADFKSANPMNNLVGESFMGDRCVEIVVGFDSSLVSAAAMHSWISLWCTSVSNYLFKTPRRQAEIDFLEYIIKASNNYQGPLFTVHDALYNSGAATDYDFANRGNNPNRSDVWGAPNFWRRVKITNRLLTSQTHAGTGSVDWYVNDTLINHFVYGPNMVPDAQEENVNNPIQKVPVGAFSELDTDAMVLQLGAGGGNGGPDWPLTIYSVQVHQRG